MSWPAIRDVLGMPAALTGKGVRIAIVDGEFPAHPDIAGNDRRNTLVVYPADHEAQPRSFHALSGPWPKGSHALWAAAAAAGSGAHSGGRYPGAAPDAELLLVGVRTPDGSYDQQRDVGRALRWLRAHWRELGVRGALSANMGQDDSGLLPWQHDPLRILCEELGDAGLLVVAGSGNQRELTCGVTQAAAPSVLAVGGVIVPPDGTMQQAAPFHGCRGRTFEGKWAPQVLAPAENLVLPWGNEELLRRHAFAAIDQLPPGYARQEGTSFAGPIALGVAACLWQAHPDWSAAQMQAALCATALHQSQWMSLGAGLLDPVATVHATAPADAVTESPFARWQRHRLLPAVQRIAALGAAEHETALGTLLSFLPEGVPAAGVPAVSRLLQHAQPRLRTAALVALAPRPGSLGPAELRVALRDGSANVRLAGIYALARAPAAWSELAPDLVERFGDDNDDVRRAALRLAGRIGSPSFVEPLIASLVKDALDDRISSWGARRDVLARITGRHFPLDPPWQEGQCPYAARTRQGRMAASHEWKQWLAAQRTAG